MMIDTIRIPFLKIQFNLDAYNFNMSFPKGKHHPNMVTIWKRFFKPKKNENFYEVIGCQKS
jgi:hypothetical protein